MGKKHASQYANFGSLHFYWITDFQSIKQVFSSTKELFFTLLEEQTIRVEQLAPPYLKYLVKNFISIISYQELFSKHGSYFLYIV